ncbi:segregation and condensation protein A [Halomicrobium urmianum]|uniref:segregation and condensation protein A n=1 Tax=Halomicrobium urmianum TaxID=1586233 RepID=UPI001CD9599D|nr:ScpA family protein [Halomicrobium urmianum]
MTSESPEDQRDEGGSTTSSGERSDPRDSEGSGESEAERSEASDSERGGTTRERSEPEPSETRAGSEATRERDDGESGDNIPLNIAGHEDRDPPGESDAGDLFGDDASADSGSDDSSENGETPAAAEAADDADGDEEVEPVEVLVQLAEEGEIDPWDIDVVQVTDKFLEVIDESDLQTSGRALFYASVLIRMKSDAMLGDDEDEEEPEEPWEAAMRGEESLDQPDPFSALDREMDRRLERKRARGMPQTLDELVHDLREAERDSWWKESRSYDTSDSPSGFRRGTQELDYRGADDLRMDDEPTADEVTANTHGEDMDAIVDDVMAAVREQFDAGRDEVLYREVEEVGGSRVETFLGLLFLAHRGRVELRQDDLFGDLWIRNPDAATGSDEAVAD